MIKATSNIKDVVGSLAAKLATLQKGGQGYDSTLREVATTMRAEMSRRIHSEGKNSNDADIGKYSTKPMYVSMSAVPKPKGVGRGKPSGAKRIKKKYGTFSYEDAQGNEIIKREVVGRETVDVAGRTKFKGGKKAGQPHTSKYYAGGYSDYKTDVGRNKLGKVNLSLTGQLSNQFAVIATTNGYGLGWVNIEMQDRAAALEKKYGQDSFKVWALTESEQKLSNEIAQEQINKIIKS